MLKKILVIDDDVAVRNAFTLALEDTEYLVETAESGEKGIEMEKEEGYDLIYLDLKMPGMNGVETLRKLWQNDKNICVYIVTAFHKEFMVDLNELVKEGINFELLRKPIERNEIIKVTSAILN